MKLKAHAVLDAVLENTGLKSDAELCRFLDISPPILSRIRAQKLNVSSNTILAIHEKTHMSVANIRKLMEKL